MSKALGDIVLLSLRIRRRRRREMNAQWWSGSLRGHNGTFNLRLHRRVFYIPISYTIYDALRHAFSACLVPLFSACLRAPTFICFWPCPCSFILFWSTSPSHSISFSFTCRRRRTLSFSFPLTATMADQTSLLLMQMDGSRLL